MTRFAELQHALAAVLTSPSSCHQNSEANELAARYVVGSSELEATERLEIYRQQFWLRHSGSLVEDYPGLAGVVGRRLWPRFVEEYLAWAQVDSWTLKDLGARLPDYVVLAATWLPHHAVCRDMALLETAYAQVFDVAELPAIEAAFSPLQPEEWLAAEFVLSPALRLLTLQYPVDELRRRLRRASAGETLAFPEPSPAFVAVYRSPDRTLSLQELSAQEWQVLGLLQSGVTLGKAFESVASDPPQLEQIVGQAATWFARWSRLQWVVDVRVSLRGGTL